MVRRGTPGMGRGKVPQGKPKREEGEGARVPQGKKKTTTAGTERSDLTLRGRGMGFIKFGACFLDA